jgi:hypothetical protein
MKTDAQIEITIYMGDLLFTLLFVFEKIVHPETLVEWLQPMLMDDDQRAMLLHEEPLYVAADFLEIDRLKANFREIERKYLEFRNSFLFNQTSAPSPQLEATLRELLASRHLSKRNTRYLHFSENLNRSIVKYAEPIGETALATTSHAKNFPQHPERATLWKMRETETPALHGLKMRRPRSLGRYAAAAHSISQRLALRKNYAEGFLLDRENDNV